MDELTSSLEHAEALQNMMLERATGGDPSSFDFGNSRYALMQDRSIAHLLPKAVKTCRTPSQFWGYIQPKYGSYKERRQHIWSEFKPLLDHLEGFGSPIDEHISESLARFDSEHVHGAWARILDRRLDDPESAITKAKSLVESVCKHIIERSEDAEYGRNDDLTVLYRKAAKALNLSPDQHTEQAFKEILGGCSSVVKGLSTLRNRVGDSHGQGSRPVKPKPHHAELAVNLAGSMAAFLVATYENRSSAGD